MAVSWYQKSVERDQSVRNQIPLAKVAAANKNFVTQAQVQIGETESAWLTLYSRGTRFDYLRGDRDCSLWDEGGGIVASGRVPAPTFEQGMINLMERFPGAKLNPDTIKTKGSRTMRGDKLQDLVLAAWIETFGVTDPSRDVMLKELHGGAAGVKKWNARSRYERRKLGELPDHNWKRAKRAGAEFRGLDMSRNTFEGADLTKAEFHGCSLEGANFAGANLEGAWLWSNCSGASFVGAKMARTQLSGEFRRAVFHKADLTKASMGYHCMLHGADFSGATLDGIECSLTDYDAETTFPPSFKRPKGMKRAGRAPASERSPRKPAPKPAPIPGSLDFDNFFTQLAGKIDEARLKKALAMLKADRFRLFADSPSRLIQRWPCCPHAAIDSFVCTIGITPC